jgi:voltage-gated potassium channel Kch
MNARSVSPLADAQPALGRAEDTLRRWARLHAAAISWTAAVALVVGLGLWGYLVVLVPVPPGPPQRLTLTEACYRTLRLFTLSMDLSLDATPPPQLWIAAFAAPLLTLRGIAELFRDQLRGGLTRYFVRPQVVVFGANERAAALITAQGHVSRWRNGVVVVDPDPQRLATMAELGAWTVRGDGMSRASLRRGAMTRATSAVIVTGDDERNMAITRLLHGLALRPEPEIYVEVEEPNLARILEQGSYDASLTITPFSAATIAAEVVLADLDSDLATTGRGGLLAAEADGTAPALVIFGTGALVDAFVLDVHRQRRVQLLEEPASGPLVPRIALFGPDAAERLQRLATLMGTELQLLDIDVFPVELDQAVELNLTTVRHLQRYTPLRQVLVLAPSDREAGGIAMTLSRHIRHGTGLTLVTESSGSPFGDEIAAQTGVLETVAPVQVVRVPQLVYALHRLQEQRIVDRLARAEHEAEHPPATRRRWSDLNELHRGVARRQAAFQLETANTAHVPIGRNVLTAFDGPELPVVTALGFNRPTALARAGLGIDLRSTLALIPAAAALLRSEHPAAFGVWCEVARLRAGPAVLVDALAKVTADHGRISPQRLADVRQLLLLHRAMGNDADARLELLAEHRHSDVGPLVDDIIVLLGPGTSKPSAMVSELLEWALGHPAPTGSVLASSANGANRWADLAATCGVSIRTPPDRQAAGPGPGRALDLWTLVVAAHKRAADIRVLALPGASTDEILLARSLGARVGWLQLPGQPGPDLARSLLNGAVGTVQLPVDRMSVRAFLRRTSWPRSAEERERLAAALHERYVQRQRHRKPAGDPALRPWAELSVWLRASNLAIVDDIPNKLAVVGLQLRALAEGGRPWPPGWPENSELQLLAEMEHGRFTVERLLSGWALGSRDPGRFLSPYLRPWEDLDNETKQYDWEVIQDLPEVLTELGLGHTPLVMVSPPSAHE